MAKSNLVERTAKEPFRLGGELVAKGRIVTLNATQLATLSNSECVAKTEAENAEVPVGDLPDLQPAPGLVDARDIEARMADARRAASDELSRLQQNIADARTQADAEVQVQQQRAIEARQKADADIEIQRQRALDATASADATVSQQQASAKAATADSASVPALAK